MDKVCKKCGCTRFFPKGGCYDCSKERNRIYRLKKGKKVRKPSKKEFCERCDKKTDRFASGLCKVCADRYKARGHIYESDIKEAQECIKNNKAFLIFNRANYHISRHTP